MIVSNTPKDMDMSEFDKAVKVLRGTVKPRCVPKRKVDCTPEEWAANLDYQMTRGRVRRRRIRQRLARAKAKKAVAKPAVVKMPAPKPVPIASNETILVFLKMAKHLAVGNEPVIEVLTMVEKLVGKV